MNVNRVNKNPALPIALQNLTDASAAKGEKTTRFKSSSIAHPPSRPGSGGSLEVISEESSTGSSSASLTDLRPNTPVPQAALTPHQLEAQALGLPPTLSGARYFSAEDVASGNVDARIAISHAAPPWSHHIEPPPQE